MLSLCRHIRRTSSSRRGGVEYGWFVYPTSQELSCPPDFIANPQLEAGDIFINTYGTGMVSQAVSSVVDLHKYPDGKRRYWIWLPGPLMSEWESISLGESGLPGPERILSTKRDGTPTWLLPSTVETYLRRHISSHT